MITLKTLGEASEQSVFDQVAGHLLRQGKQSMYGTNCYYRMGDLSCAVGCLIGDDEYYFKMEGKTYRRFFVDHGTTARHYDLLVELQRLHDGKDPVAWCAALRDLAEEYGLSAAVVDGFDRVVEEVEAVYG